MIPLEIRIKRRRKDQKGLGTKAKETQEVIEITLICRGQSLPPRNLLKICNVAISKELSSWRCIQVTEVLDILGNKRRRRKRAASEQQLWILENQVHPMVSSGEARATIALGKLALWVQEVTMGQVLVARSAMAE